MDNHQCLALMGIDVWIERKTIQQPKNSKPHRLTIVLDNQDTHNPKCQALLSNILHYLKIQMTDCQLIDSKQYKLLTAHNANSIIQFGNDNLDHVDSKITQTIGLSTLLEMPHKKQQVLHDIAKLPL